MATSISSSSRPRVLLRRTDAPPDTAGSCIAVDQGASVLLGRNRLTNIAEPASLSREQGMVALGDVRAACPFTKAFRLGPTAPWTLGPPQQRAYRLPSALSPSPSIQCASPPRQPADVSSRSGGMRRPSTALPLSRACATSCSTAATLPCSTPSQTACGSASRLTLAVIAHLPRPLPQPTSPSPAQSGRAPSPPMLLQPAPDHPPFPSPTSLPHTRKMPSRCDSPPVGFPPQHHAPHTHALSHSLLPHMPCTFPDWYAHKTLLLRAFGTVEARAKIGERGRYTGQTLASRMPNQPLSSPLFLLLLLLPSGV